MRLTPFLRFCKLDQMAAENIKKIIQELVVPELQEIKSDIKELKVEVRRLDEKMDSLRNEMHSEIRRVDEKLETAMNLRERLVVLEAKVLGH